MDVFYFLATKPGDQQGKKGVKHDFKMAPDGRLIIREDKDEEELINKKGA